MYSQGIINIVEIYFLWNWTRNSRRNDVESASISAECRYEFARRYGTEFRAKFRQISDEVRVKFDSISTHSEFTGLGIPVKTKKPPLSNQYTTRGTAFRL